MANIKLYNALEILGALLVPGFCIYVRKMSEPGFMGLNDYQDFNSKKSNKSFNHKNHSSDFIELVYNG